MKYNKRDNFYQGSNVTYFPDIQSAWSYGWWQFIGRTTKGKVIRNTYSYSQSTTRQQDKVNSLMFELNHLPDLVLYYSKKSLSDGWEVVLKDEIEQTEIEISRLDGLLVKPRVRTTTKEKAKAEISTLKGHLEEINIILKEG